MSEHPAHFKRSENWAYIVTIIGFTVLVLSIFLVFYQIGELRQVVSSQNNIALSTMFFNDVNTGIIDALETGGPILTVHKGKYTKAQLDNYLGDFETIDSAYSEGLLSEDEFCVSFSYYVTLTSQNDEVKAYLTSSRKQDSGFFGGLSHLVNVVAKSKKLNCHKLA
jgi:hypothetical protein